MSETTPPAATPEPPPLGDHTAPILLAMFQDFYRQEVGAEEDVHRTLPFFATALGLIVAAINYAAGQLPAWDALTKACPQGRGRLLYGPMLSCGWPALLAAALLVLAALLGIGVLALLAAATKRRAYKRVGPEAAHLARAKALQAYHQGLGLTGPALDEAVALDLREQLLNDFAQVIPLNRELTLQRYRLRARAVSWLLWSLLSALVATMSLLATTKSGFLIKVTP